MLPEFNAQMVSLEGLRVVFEIQQEDPMHCN